MTVGTTELNPGSGGNKVLHDTLTTVDGAGAPASAVAPIFKMAWGAQNVAELVSMAKGLPVQFSNDVTVTGPSAQNAVNTNLLTGSVSGWYDAAAFQSGSIQIIATSGISAGAVIFEQTNDITAAPNGVPLRAYEASVISTNPNVAAITIAASTQRIFIVPINARYVRARISTAFVGGTVQAVATFSQRAASFGVMNVQQATAANLNVTVGGLPATPAGANIIGYTPVPLPTSVTDVASAAITGNATTAAITPSWGTAYEVNIPVSVVSGTSPTLDVVVQESDDGGNSWFDVYHFPRITAIGTYRSPKLPLTGNRVRYVQTLGGTSPSFTRAINRLQSSETPPAFRQLFDRSLAASQALNALTGSINAQNCRNAQLVINAGSIATTAPAIQLQGTDDNGGSWYDIGTPLIAVANKTVQLTVANIQTQQLRGIVTTAGSGATLGYVLIKGF